MSATLKAEPREKLGSRFARRLRAAGRIPATIQGEPGNHVDLSIESQSFWTARRAHEHLFDIEIAGDTETAVVRELQWDSFGDEIVHVEFKRVQRGVKMESEVEIEFSGHTKGGVLTTLLSHVTVTSLPKDIPDSVVAKVEGLDVGDHVLAGQIELPEGVELAVDPDLQVATITGARGLAEDEPAAEEAAEGEEPEAGEAPAES